MHRQVPALAQLWPPARPPVCRWPLPLQTLKHAFSYSWRLWTILDVTELLRQAGFAATHVWLRPMKVRAGGRDWWGGAGLDAVFFHSGGLHAGPLEAAEGRAGCCRWLRTLTCPPAGSLAGLSMPRLPAGGGQ